MIYAMDTAVVVILIAIIRTKRALKQAKLTAVQDVKLMENAKQDVILEVLNAIQKEQEYYVQQTLTVKVIARQAIFVFQGEWVRNAQ